MMAVNSLTPNMPRFDTLQKSQHSTAYRACQLVRGHRQLRSQSCSEHAMACYSVMINALCFCDGTVVRNECTMSKWYKCS